jgi:ankyrin repeat protein
MDAAPDLLHLTDNDGRTPLHLALWNNDPSPIIRKVVERAGEVSLERDSAGLTPLATAVGRGAEMVISHLPLAGLLLA